ncbi:MAG: hypothetical protein GY798_10875 [Hyphomicrobiales bacterium]|nr:hypothetical protein [Hyphomicrobiales bacterium]
MKRCFSICAAALALCGTPILGHAEDVDMADMSCQELMDMSVEEVVVTGAWMSGFFNAKANNTVLDTELMPVYGAALGEYCAQNPEELLMQAVGKLFVVAE